MLNKVAFTMYTVKDLSRAQNFYEKILGLKSPHLSSNGQWVEYDLPGGGCFALTTLAQGVEPSHSSGGVVAFEVDHLDELIADLKTQEVKIKLDVFATPVCRMAVIIDSEGNGVILHQVNAKS